MNLLEIAATHLGRIKAAYDLPLLQKAWNVDEIGRTLPMSLTGAAGVSWLSGDGARWAALMRGQVWRVNNFFATTAAAVPLALYKPGADGKAERVTKHPLLDLLYQPNPDQGKLNFDYAVATQLKATGNCFISRVKPEIGSKRGQPSELWILPVLNVQPMVDGKPVPDGVTLTKPVDGYRYTPDLSKPGTYHDLKREEVLHLKMHNPAGGPYGLGCIVAANREITGDDASITAQVAQLQNMGPRGVLWFEPVNNQAPQLGDTVVPDMRRRLGRDFSGPRNAGQFPILTNKVGWTQLGTSVVDLDILNFRQANFNDLCGYWGVPSILLGDKNGVTFANMSEARKMLYSQGIMPHVQLYASELSRWLCPQFDATYWLEPDTAAIPELQQDKKALAEWLNLCPWIPVQRKAEIMGEEVDKNFTGYLVPAALVYVKNIAELGGAPEPLG